jgi:hypothetical protein
MSQRRKVTLTVEKLGRLEIKLLRRIENLTKQYVAVRNQKGQLEKALAGEQK